MQNLLKRTSQLNAIIQSQDDGVAPEKCRVLCKNSNDRTAQQARGDGFIAGS
jgi:hypothetical protein